MLPLVRLLFSPLVFGCGFLAPLFAQILALTAFSAPFGMSNITVGLVIGGSWGLLAQLRGSWVWVKP